MKNSFSAETKTELCANVPKTECCRRSLLCGILIFRQPKQSGAAVSLAEKLEREFIEKDDMAVTAAEGFFECESCPRCYLRGVFLSCGTVADPSKLYHLELAVSESAGAADVSALIEKYGLNSKITVRRGRHIVYLKGSEEVSGFLHLIGAQNAAFRLIDRSIYKDYRNAANRRTNCDSANINRAVSAAQLQLEAIRALYESGKLSALPPELYETARLRAENVTATLAELADMHVPPITKSGVNHRLKKLTEYYGKFKEES